MVDIQTDWEIKGIYQEACDSEGHCPYFLVETKKGGVGTLQFSP